jgi:hypothetical protein
VTYPDDQVVGLLNAHFIPVQVNIEQASRLADQYQALWTPNLNFIDGRERRFCQVIGWLPPSEFAAMLHLARGQYLLTGKHFDEAAPVFLGVFERFPRSAYAPEALYFHGVSRYLSSHEVPDLKDAWGRLQRFYPQSKWAMMSNLL